MKDRMIHSLIYSVHEKQEEISGWQNQIKECVILVWDVFGLSNGLINQTE